ncbi:TetR/AcrR family transcriptional regulator [Kibdelosporangium lantanae]|uniref:TetR/AcrR family transcriptional regulator n=1 Tax=Kibdelosporangium lantanae TaxID=1497396 RepID=A0ABW3M9P9_9PSEU
MSAEPRPGGRPRDASLDEAIIQATRTRLIQDGYTKMTIGDIATDAGVTRPTLYRRWATKLDLVVDALDYGFRSQRAMYTVDLSALAPREALVEAVRRLDPAYFNPDAMVLMGNFAGEAIRTPALLEILRQHAVEPRVSLIETVLTQLQERGAVRADVDRRTVATMCFGAYFAAFYRGEGKDTIPEAVIDTLWPALATKPKRR